MTPLDWVVYPFAVVCALRLLLRFVTWQTEALHVIRGTVFPHPEDPDWRLEVSADSGTVAVLTNGRVLVHWESDYRSDPKKALVVGGVEDRSVEARAYVEAVVRAHQHRSAEEQFALKEKEAN